MDTSSKVSSAKVQIKYPEIGYNQLLYLDTIIMEKNRKGDETITFHHEREIEIIYLGHQDGMSRYQIFLLQSTYLMSNDLKPFKELLERLSYVADECFVAVSDKGKINHVINLEFIQYRWHKVVRPILLELYNDPDFLAYVYQHDAIFKDQASVVAYLNSYEVYGNYFNDYYRIVYEMSTPIFIERLENEEKILENAFCAKWTNADDQLAVLHINGTLTNYAAEMESPIRAEYTYLNGKVEEGKRIIKHHNRKLQYHIRWVGLRKIKR